MSAARRLVDQRRTERQQAEFMRLYQAGHDMALPAAAADKKDKPCFNLRDKGTCEKGSSCPYSHDPEIVEKARRAKAESKGKGKGKGKGGGPAPKPKPAPKRICRFFNSPKGCSHGSACTWLHERPAMAAQLPPPTPTPPAQDAAKSGKNPGP